MTDLTSWLDRFFERIPSDAVHRRSAAIYTGGEEITQPSGEWVFAADTDPTAHIQERYRWTDAAESSRNVEDVLRIYIETQSIDGRTDGVDSYLDIEVCGTEIHGKDAVFEHISDAVLRLDADNIDGDVTAVHDVFEISPRHRRVVGVADQREEITEFLSRETDSPRPFARRGLLLEGPPGTGKTELVVDVCQSELGGLPTVISGPEILNKWVGESERLLRQKFEEARQHAPHVLYIDELDAIGSSRESSSQEYAKHIVAQLLVLMDGIGAKDNNRTDGKASPATDSRDLKVIASTNRPDALDAALLRPGRFGNRPVTFEAPGAEAAKQILHFYLEQVRSRTELSLSGDLEAFVARGESAEVHRFTQNHLTGLTGAEIEGLVGEATRMTRRRKEPNSASDLTLTTLEQSYETGPYTADYADRPIDADPTTTVDPGVLEQLENSLVAYSETHSDAPRDILKAYAEWIEPDTVLYRSIDARILIGDSTVDTTAYITSRLTPPGQSAVCVVLQNTDRLIHAASQGVPSAKQALTITNEQIATWNKSNLLITEGVGDLKRDWFLSIYETDIYEATRE
jgi:transitional endoplasmic reticulum ATPase